jgi:formylglycine-generating enzyme required for sulfatase activity
MEFIPEGEYLMGDHHDGMWQSLPVHAVYIDAFYMDKFEVTNEEYCTFLNSAYTQGLIEVIPPGVVFKKNDTEPYCDTYSSDPDSRIHWTGSDFRVTSGKEDHPMVNVSWYGAAAYANWRSARELRIPCYNLNTWECTFGVGGYRLPTEAEWEKAARGGENTPYFRYPWGDSLNGSKANYWASGDPYEIGDYPWTTPVGYYDGNQYPPGVDMANGYGLYDMAGNVFEWCNDWYDSNYYNKSPYDNPTGPSSGTLHVLRGGSWNGYEHHLRCAGRQYSFQPDGRGSGLGFRLVLE